MHLQEGGGKKGETSGPKEGEKGEMDVRGSFLKKKGN